MFGILKAIDDRARITVLKETPTANGADLHAEATIDADQVEGHRRHHAREGARRLEARTRELEGRDVRWR